MKKFLNIGNSIDILRIGVGTFGIGGYFEKFQDYDESDEISQIRYMFEQGYNAIDCWALQASGNLMSVLNKAIKGYPREKLFITGKLDVRRFKSKKEIMERIDLYLKEVGIDYIDLIEIHSPNFPDVSQTDVIQEMKLAVKLGKAKQLGVCNANGEQIEALVTEAGENAFVSHAFPYNLIDRKFEENGGIKASRKHGMKLLIAKPLAQGMVSYLWSIDNDIFDMSRKYKTSPTQLALAWLLKDEDLFVWCKSLNRSHIVENTKAMDLVISPKDLEFLTNWKLKRFKDEGN